MWTVDRQSYRSADDGSVSFYLYAGRRPASDACLEISDDYFAGRPVRILTWNRPDTANALSIGLLIALRRAILDAPPHATIVLAGAEETFCSGLDVKEMKKAETPRKHLTLFMDLLEAMNHRAPIASLIRGVSCKDRPNAYAGGFGIACFSHAAVAQVGSKLEIPTETVYRPLARLLVPVILRRRQVPPTLFEKLLDKTLDGKEIPRLRFDVEQAKDLGLIDQICESGKQRLLLDAALSVLEKKHFLSDAWIEYRKAIAPEAVAALNKHWKRKGQKQRKL